MSIVPFKKTVVWIRELHDVFITVRCVAQEKNNFSYAFSCCQSSDVWANQNIVKYKVGDPRSCRGSPCEAHARRRSKDSANFL